MEKPFNNIDSNQKAHSMSRVWRKIQKSSNQFIIFIFIGLCAFAVDYLLYIFFLHQGIPMNIAKVSSSVFSVLFNYILNAKFNFGRSHTLAPKHVSYYFLMYVVLIIINIGLNKFFFILTNEVHLAVLTATAFSMFINFFGVRKFFNHFNK